MITRRAYSFHNSECYAHFTSARADDLMSQKSPMITYKITVGYVTLYSFWYVYVTTYDLKIVLYFDFDKTCPPRHQQNVLWHLIHLGTPIHNKIL